MSIVLTIIVFAAGIALAFGRGLVAHEINGRLQRHAREHLGRTISALPDELQAEWAEEWRAELGAVITMPLTAAQFVHGARRAAARLVALSEPQDASRLAQELSIAAAVALKVHDHFDLPAYRELGRIPCVVVETEQEWIGVQNLGSTHFKLGLLDGELYFTRLSQPERWTSIASRGPSSVRVRRVPKHERFGRTVDSGYQ